MSCKSLLAQKCMQNQSNVFWIEPRFSSIQIGSLWKYCWLMENLEAFNFFTIFTPFFPSVSHYDAFNFINLVEFFLSLINSLGCRSEVQAWCVFICILMSYLCVLACDDHMCVSSLCLFSRFPNVFTVRKLLIEMLRARERERESD